MLLLFLQIIQRPHSKSGPPCLEDLVAKKEKVMSTAEKSSEEQFVNYVISSTPELAKFHSAMDARWRFVLAGDLKVCKIGRMI